jgi:hypothetical protein
MAMLQGAHLTYLVLLSGFLAGCVWIARRADLDR